MGSGQWTSRSGSGKRPASGLEAMIDVEWMAEAPSLKGGLLRTRVCGWKDGKSRRREEEVVAVVEEEEDEEVSCWMEDVER